MKYALHAKHTHRERERERDTVLKTLKTLKSGSKQANGCAAGKHNKLNR